MIYLIVIGEAVLSCKALSSSSGLVCTDKTMIHTMAVTYVLLCQQDVGGDE
jgi:hypothetical protein